jgi:chromosome segregation ATPase
MLRTAVLCCALGSVLGLTVGCNWSSSGTGALKTREEAVATFKSELDKLDKKIAELKDKAEKASGDDKSKLEARWKEIVKKREAVGKKLDEVSVAAIEKWEALKKEADNAIEELKKSIGD